MSLGTIDASQRGAARVAGIAYLSALVTANFAAFYVPFKLVVDGNAAATIANIAASQRLYRLGIASDVLTFAIDVALVVALYVILRPVNPNLALLAAAWRLVETSILVVATLNGFSVVGLAGNASYVRGFTAEQLQGLTMVFRGAHGGGYDVGLIFFGLGSAAFSYLFFESDYIPKLLAGLGVFASLAVAACAFAFIVFPDLANVLEPACFVPIFIFELITGIWLLWKGVRAPRRSPSAA